MLLAPPKQEGNTIKHVLMSTKNAKRRETYTWYTLKKWKRNKDMRSRHRLFPERTRLLFAGTISPIIRALLYGPSNNKCFGPQPHTVQLGVPKPPVFLIWKCSLYPMRFDIFISPDIR